MAFANIKTAKKPKRKGATKSVDHRFIGDEPVTVTEENYSRALSWYSYTWDVDKGREYLLEYLKAKKAPRNELMYIRRCPKERIITTACWQARMMTNGNTLPPSSQEYFKDRFAFMLEAGRLTREEVKVEKSDKPSIQERTQNKNRQIFADCESEVIDQQKSIYEYLQRHEVTPSAATFMLSKFQPIYDEVMSDDPEVKEGFGKRLKAERKYWQGIIDDLERYVGNKKAVKIRKPKAKKVKAAIDVVKKLSYQKEDPSLKIVSINPAEIIGAQQLWTYNTKYKKLTVFYAVGPAGFTVKGTTLYGFDEKTSVSKRLRKPQEAISELLVAGKVTLRKFMDNLTTSASLPKGRLNSDTILLKAVK